MNKIVKGAVIGSAIGAVAIWATECKLPVGGGMRLGKKLLKAMGI